MWLSVYGPKESPRRSNCTLADKARDNGLSQTSKATVEPTEKPSNDAEQEIERQSDDRVQETALFAV